MIYSGVCVGGVEGVHGGAVSRIVGLPIFSNPIEKVTVPAATESFFLWFRLFSMLWFFVALQFPVC